MYNLFLDDERTPDMAGKYMHAFIGKKNLMYFNEQWIVVKTYEEFVQTVTELGLPWVVSFDHDLAYEHYEMHFSSKGGEMDYDKLNIKCGMDCVKWLVDYCDKNNLEFPEYYLHTANPVGKKNMDSYISSYLKSKTL